MVWCPSFQSRLRADGVREYRVGHELVDEFLEFASGRARPSTVRAYAHDLSVFFGVIGKEPAGRDPQGRAALRDRPAAPEERCRERGADLRRRVGVVDLDHQATAGRGVEPLWLSRHPGRRRCGDQPGATGSAHPAQPAPW